MTSWRARYLRHKPQHPTSTCRGILRRLRQLGMDLPGPDDRYRVRNIHSGHHQRSAGAYSWVLDIDDPTDEQKRTYISGSLGGYWAAQMCMRKGAELSDVDRYGDQFLEPPQSVKNQYMARKYGH